MGNNSTSRKNFPEFSTDIEQVANQLKIDKFGVMSHSRGSPYAFTIAYKLKDRLTKVVLVSPLGPLNVLVLRKQCIRLLDF